MAGNNRESGRSVSSKIFAVLRAVGESGGDVSAADVARLSGLPSTTVLRLLKEMHENGIVRRNDHNRYEIGLDIWRLGMHAPELERLREIALPHLHELHRRTGENVNLAVMDRNDCAVNIDKISSGASWRVAGRTAGEMPLHATSAGKVLLAYCSNARIAEVLSQPLTRYTPFTVVNPVILRQQLEAIRRDGYGSAREEINLASLSFAAPILYDGRAQAAISLVAHYQTAKRHNLLALVVETAKRIETDFAARVSES